MAITNDYILKGGLRSSDEAANSRLRMMDQERIQQQQDAAAGQRGQADNDAKLAQLLKGSQLKQKQVSDNAAAAEEAAKRQGFQPGQYAASASDEGYHIAPVDGLDKQLKRAQLQNATDDREDRIKGRETNNIQQFYDHAGGKNYAQKAATLQKAQALLAKGDPESLRAAELELSTGLAQNALTQQEYGALTSAHGAGNTMQAGTKNLAQIVQNMVPAALGGDKLANFLSQRAANMKTMTPDEIRQKASTAQSMFEANRHSADSIRDELQQRAPQLAPSMARRDPRGLGNVIDSLGARIPDQNITPGQITQSRGGAAQAPTSSGKQVVKVMQNKRTGQKKITYSDGSEEIQ